MRLGEEEGVLNLKPHHERTVRFPGAGRYYLLEDITSWSEGMRSVGYTPLFGDSYPNSYRNLYQILDLEAQKTRRPQSPSL